MPYAKNEGVDLYYEVHGEGKETIVLAHGMGGNAAIWFNQIAHFALRYRVIAFDHRHFARSVCDVTSFKPELFASDALAILAAEEITSAIWVCQSMGGWTGSQVALQAPEKVRALIMSHTPGVFEHDSAVNDTSRLAQTLKSGFLPALAEDFPVRQPAMATLYGAINAFNHTDNREVSTRIGRAKLGVDIDTLAHYAIPTLFITGELDVLFESTYIEALAAALPGARYCNLGPVGHSSYFEAPAEFNAAVEGFLQSLD